MRKKDLCANALFGLYAVKVNNVSDSMILLRALQLMQGHFKARLLIHGLV